MTLTTDTKRPLLSRLAVATAVLGLVAAPALAHQQEAGRGAQGRQAGSAEQPADGANQNLPSGKDVLAKYVAATGGAEAYKNLKTQHATGTFALPAMGMSGKFELFQQAPDKFLVLIDLPGMGQIQNGVNGDLGWALDPMSGPRLLEGEEMKAAKREAATDAYTNPDKHYSSVEVKGIADVDGKKAYHVVLTPTEGGKPTEVYFDVESGLALKSVSTQQSPMGEMKAETIMADYKKTADGKFTQPHKMTTRAGGQEYVITLEKVESNAEIPAGRFEPPAEVKQMAEQKKAAGGNANGNAGGDAGGAGGGQNGGM